MIKPVLGVMLCGLMLVLPNSVYALDSYRYLHVSIDTVWKIFLFLLVGILGPFIVVACLYWRQAQRKRDKDRHDNV